MSQVNSIQFPRLTIGSGIQVDQDALEEAVSRINTAISDFDLEIRKTLDQTTGDALWAIVLSLLCFN